jgi:hypothetical protein
MQKGQKLAQLLLDAGIVLSCGLIPPPRIVAQVLRSGRSPFDSATVQTWERFDLDEGHYWIAARNLRESSSAPTHRRSYDWDKGTEALAKRPDLAGVKIDVDTSASSATGAARAPWSSCRVR